MAWSTSETYGAEKFYLFSCDSEEFSARQLSARKTVNDLSPMFRHPRRVDMTPLAAAEYVCRLSGLVLKVKDLKQHLPKIVISGVEDFGTVSDSDDGVIVRKWTDGRYSQLR